MTASAAEQTASIDQPGLKGPDRGRYRFSTAMSARDLINVGIFAAIYFAIVFAIAMLGVISPLVMVLTLPLSIIVAGVPYMLFLTRVRHGGMVALFGTIIALLYLVSGQPIISTALTIALSLIGEGILWAGKYASKWAAIWTYTVFSLWFVGPFLPVFLSPDEYFSSASMQAMGSEYADGMRELLTTPVVLGFAVGALVCGVLGGILGSALLRKHFRKAGLA